MTRDEITLRVFNTLLTSGEYSYDTTVHAAHDAVETADLLIKLLAQPEGTVKYSQADAFVENLEAQAEAAEEAAEAAEVVGANDETTIRKKSFFGF